MLVVTPVSAFHDNYIWVFRASESKECYVVDPGDSNAVIDFLGLEQLELAGILITHHHHDHTGGIRKLLSHKSVPVYGPASGQIQSITNPLKEGDSIELSGSHFSVIATPGHTLDHLVYYMPGTEDLDPLIFCGDTLFSGGCGRLFEGSAEQMQQSMDKLTALPDNTRVYCAHEYTQANLTFANALEPDNPILQNYIIAVNKLRANNMPSLPSTISLEREINPFMRTRNKTIIDQANTQMGLTSHSPSEVFGAIRALKDNF